MDEVTNAPNNEAKLKVIEKYYALSQEFREAEPEKAEDMEEAFMDILETITKYDGCGIKFQVDREQGLHQNLYSTGLSCERCIEIWPGNL